MGAARDTKTGEDLITTSAILARSVLAMRTQSAAGVLHFTCVLASPGNAHAAPRQLNLNLWGWHPSI